MNWEGIKINAGDWTTQSDIFIHFRIISSNLSEFIGCDHR